MTVKELIDKLREMPPDAKVIYTECDTTEDEIKTVTARMGFLSESPDKIIVVLEA